MHGTEAVSPWVARWAHLVADGARVLDLACGAGRHTHHFLQRNCRVTGVDIAQSALDSIASELPADVKQRCELIAADVENGPWPLQGRQFDGVVVTNYLWRALWKDLLGCLRPGGVLIYETFSEGNETVGKPSRADFLLKSGELLSVAQAYKLQVVAYECGFVRSPDRFVQRIVAVAGTGSGADPHGHAASPPRHLIS